MTYNLSEIIVSTAPKAELSEDEKERKQKIIDILRDIALLEFDLDILRDLYGFSLVQLDNSTDDNEEEYHNICQERKEVVEAYVKEINKKELELKQLTNKS